MENNDQYETRDLTIAAFLMSSGFTLMKADPREERGKTKYYFIFYGVENINQAIAAFNASVARVEPRGFHKNLNQLKTMIIKGERHDITV